MVPACDGQTERRTDTRCASMPKSLLLQVMRVSSDYNLIKKAGLQPCSRSRWMSVDDEWSLHAAVWRAINRSLSTGASSVHRTAEPTPSAHRAWRIICHCLLSLDASVDERLYTTRPVISVRYQHNSVALIIHRVRKNGTDSLSGIHCNFVIFCIVTLHNTVSGHSVLCYY